MSDRSAHEMATTTPTVESAISKLSAIFACTMVSEAEDRVTAASEIEM